MKKKKPSGKWALLLPPKYFGGLFFSLMVIFLGTSIFEYQYRKQELEHIMREEATLLIHALTEGAENAISGYNENSSLLIGSLIDQLSLLDRLDQQRALTSARLPALVGSDESMLHLMVVDRHGRTIATNTPPTADALNQQCNPQTELQPLFSGEMQTLVLGIRRGSSTQQPRLIAAVARSRGGAIVGSLDASRLIALRRQLGVGKLIQRIGADKTGIDYIIWQDSSAILAATPNVSGAAPLLSDAFLAAALTAYHPATRLTTFDGRSVFEVVKPFIYQGTNIGLFRVGLKTDHFTAALAKLRNRVIMLLVLVGFGGLVMFNLVMSRRNAMLMKGACERAQSFSSTILESMADAVIAVNATADITLLNDAAEKLFGLSAHVALNKPIAQLLPDIAALLHTLMLENRAAFSKEFEAVIGGKNLLLSAHCSLITGHNGDEGALVVVRDLSEQRAMQNIINRQEKLTAMGELASGVAHEIRNPLNAIGVLAQRLDMEFSPIADEDDYRHLVRLIVSEVHRVNAIIQRFLKFARPTPLMMVKSNLDDFVTAYCPLLQGEADAKGLSFTLQAESGAAVLLDPEQMQQALLNIVQNGVEATESGGTLSIVLFRRALQAIIAITDSGCGISDKEIAQIFNLYFTTKQDGTGLGLSIANQIVQAHGGIIEVESMKQGGTQFRIVLPLASF